MAKWRPSLKQLSIYDELLKRQNIARKQVLKRRRIAEETSFGRGLPDLVIPKKARRFKDIMKYSNRFNSYEDYRNKIRALQDMYGRKGDVIEMFYKSVYKDKILGLIKDWINDIVGFHEDPKGYFGKYSDLQFQLVSKEGEKFLELYNKLVSLSKGEFMTMYDSGFIPKLQFVYDEMSKGQVKFSFVSEFLYNFSDFRRQARDQSNIMIKSLNQHFESLAKSKKIFTPKGNKR